MKAIAIVQARMASTRFPGKVLAALLGRPMLGHVVERCQAIPGVEAVCLSIPRGADDDVLLWWAGKLGIVVHRGQERLPGTSANDCLAAYARAAEIVKADVVVRVTADCPLIDPELAGHVLAPVLRGEAIFASNCYPRRTYPDGLDVEAFTNDLLQSASVAATEPGDREHVTQFMRREGLARIWNEVCGEDLSAVRWTVDSKQDLEPIRRILAHLPEGAYRMADTRKAAEEAGCWP